MTSSSPSCCIQVIKVNTGSYQLNCECSMMTATLAIGPKAAGLLEVAGSYGFVGGFAVAIV